MSKSHTYNFHRLANCYKAALLQAHLHKYGLSTNILQFYEE